MTLKDQIDAEVKAIREVLGRMRDSLTKVEKAFPAAVRQTGEVRHLQIDINSRLQQILVLAGKEVMLGGMEQATRQDLHSEYELMQPRALMLESLHRAGDHTLDDEEGVKP